MLNWLRRRLALTVTSPLGGSQEAVGEAQRVAQAVEAVDAAVKRLETLEASFGRYSGEMALLRLEWAEVLDKVAAWGDRQSARDRKRVAAALKEEETPPASPVPLDRQSIKAQLRSQLAARRRGTA